MMRMDGQQSFPAELQDVAGASGAAEGTSVGANAFRFPGHGRPAEVSAGPAVEFIHSEREAARGVPDNRPLLIDQRVESSGRCRPCAESDNLRRKERSSEINIARSNRLGK